MTAFLGLFSMVVPAAAVVDEPDIDSSAHYVYVVDPNANAIHARIELTITADKPDQTVADGVYQYYFTGYGLLIPAEATDLRALDQSGVELSVEREVTGELSDVLTIDFRRNIFYRQQAIFTIEFSLPAGQADSDTIVRLNPAIASFIAWTSPLLEEATVTVVVPPGFEDRSSGPDRFEITREGADQQLLAADIDPETYFTVVSVVNDDALEVDVVDVPNEDDSTIRIESWPGDAAWRDYVVDGVETALPVLTELVGQPWPIEGELTITESFSPYIDGYAGWYDRETEIIEVGDRTDNHVLYHELAHAWLHGDLFAHRWITEGLAEVYSAETIAALGEERPEPTATSTSHRDAIPLAEFDFSTQPETERWGYNASWTVVDAVVDEIGLDGMAEVIDAASDRRLTYLGDGEPETTTSTADWRRFLDLVENVQGVDAGPVAELIQEWVLSEDYGDHADAVEFQRRQEARARYSEVEAEADGWAPSFELRDAMGLWQFPKAEGLLTEAEEALDRRGELQAVVESTGAELPAELEELYERLGERTAADDLDAAFTDVAEAGAEVRESHDLVAADRSLLQRVGLLGADLDTDVEAAVDAFSAGRLDRAIALADDTQAHIDGSARAGALRSGGALALLATIVGGAWFVRRLRRRRRPVVVTTSATATEASPD